MSRQEVVKNAVESLLKTDKLCGISRENFAYSLMELTGESASLVADWRGDVPIYPASIVKLFYLVAAFHWIEKGGLSLTDELERALKDMIVDSSNDATSYAIDCMTGTTSGPELEAKAMDEWMEKRFAIHRYFQDLDYKDLNIIQKPWGDGPYGREHEFVEKHNRNRLTTNATARLFADLVFGKAATAQLTTKAMTWLKREPTGNYDNPEDQANAFSAKGLALTDKLWSKGGWTSVERHDAACIERADGKRFIVVVFTQNHPRDLEIIPNLVRAILSCGA